MDLIWKVPSSRLPRAVDLLWVGSLLTLAPSPHEEIEDGRRATVDLVLKLRCAHYQPPEGLLKPRRLGFTWHC